MEAVESNHENTVNLNKSSKTLTEDGEVEVSADNG